MGEVEGSRFGVNRGGEKSAGRMKRLGVAGRVGAVEDDATGEGSRKDGFEP